jgi:hypothetical protein
MQQQAETLQQGLANAVHQMIGKAWLRRSLCSVILGKGKKMLILVIDHHRQYRYDP